jgi:hypothetical protein
VVTPECVTPDLGATTFEGVNPPFKALICNGLNRSTLSGSKGVEPFRCSVYVPGLTLKKESPVVLENLDRTQWSFAEAHAHVEAVVLSLESERFAGTMLIKGPMPPLDEMPAQWLRSKKFNAREQLLVALLDGDLHAQGRLSTTRSG